MTKASCKLLISIVYEQKIIYDFAKLQKIAQKKSSEEMPKVISAVPDISVCEIAARKTPAQIGISICRD